MLISHLKRLLYTLVALVVFDARAGSFEDFFIAIRNDNVGVVSNLLDRGFDPNTRNEKGQIGLVLAMQEHSLKAARALLGRPLTDINALNQAGESALMMAALKGDLEGMKLLLDRGARVNQPGWGPLHYAATGPEPKAIELLLARGAEVDAKSPNDSTPLMMAARYGSEDSTDLLLARGADPRQRNQLHLNAADFAREAGREALAKRLDQAAR